MKFILESSDETLTTHSGLALVGLLLDKTNLDTRINALALPHIKSSPFISNADVARSYLGLLCQGKHDFDHIEAFREDEFFSLALHLSHVPSSPTLRQRLNQLAQTNRYSSLLLEESADLLRTVQVCPTPITLEGPHPSRSYSSIVNSKRIWASNVFPQACLLRIIWFFILRFLPIIYCASLGRKA